MKLFHCFFLEAPMYVTIHTGIALGFYNALECSGVRINIPKFKLSVLISRQF